MIEINKENFDREVLQSDLPVLVEFGGTWCPPCRKLLPLLQEMDNESNGKYKICKVDIDEQPELTERYEIHSIPLCLIFQNGNLKNKFLGLTTKEKLLESLSHG